MNLKKEKEEKRNELWTAMLAQNPTVRDLRGIIIDIPSFTFPSLYEKVMQELLAQAASMSKKDLVMIMDMGVDVDSSVRDELGRVLLTMEPTTDDLVLIIKYAPSLREEVARLLLSKKKATTTDIYTILELVESLREEAWQRFLKKKPNNYELIRVIRGMEQLREVAWQELLKRKPTNEQLFDIVEYVKPLREEAQKVLDARTGRKDRDDIAEIMDRKREMEQDGKKSRDRRGLIDEMYALRKR